MQQGKITVTEEKGIFSKSGKTKYKGKLAVKMSKIRRCRKGMAHTKQFSEIWRLEREAKLNYAPVGERLWK